MLKLYHGNTSVCSVKVRIGLAEKQLEWDSKLLNLPKGEQHDPEYLKINPNGVVPTLIDGDLIVTESSVILEYADELSPHNPLMPSGKAARTLTKIWLLRCLDIHAAINTMTFSTVKRQEILAKNTPDEIAISIAKMPNPFAAEKRKELIEKGLTSSHVTAAFFTLHQMFKDMQLALQKSKWLAGDQFSLPDVSLIAYVDRLESLGMAGLWTKHTPLVGDWLNAAQARPSYSAAIDPFISPESAAKTRANGEKLWPQVSEEWELFLKEK